MKRGCYAVYLIVLVLVCGCSGDGETGPAEVRWDRDRCARCAMAVSDRMYAAQVRGGADGERTRPYFFDEIGCAVIWVDQQPWKEDARTKIWVVDTANGEWIDAQEAWYYEGHRTPMDYGLGAEAVRRDGALDFGEAVAHIYGRDKPGARPRGGEEGSR